MRLLESEPGDRRATGSFDLGRLVGPLFRHSRDALLVVDAESGRVVLRNRSAEALFGRAAEEPAPPPIEALLPGLIAPAAATDGALSGARHGLTALLDGEPRATRAVRRSGDELPVEVVASPADGSTVGYVLLLLRPLDDRARAETAERRLEEVLTLVNHDVRTPLTGIVGFAELLLERSFTSEKQRQLLECIRREAARLDGLLGQLPRSTR
jgi:signal transduction histidine kinase